MLSGTVGGTLVLAPRMAAASPDTELQAVNAVRWTGRPAPKMVVHLPAIAVSTATPAPAGASGPAAPAAPVGPTYVNPVYRHDAPDPSLIRGNDGLYYLYSTQSEYGRHVNIPLLSSPDLVHWRFRGDALPNLPSWSQAQSWAPEIDRVGATYRLYFASQMRGSGDMAIAMATAPSPYGPFVDSGHPVVTGHGIAALDPFVLPLSDGRRLIYWGSGGAPIQTATLSADGGSIVEAPRAVLYPNGGPYERLIEGAWVIQHGPWFYMMYSGDRCCLAEAHYAVMVARSTSPFGPFVREPRNPILATNGAFHAPGHNATIKDAAGQDWILYHAMLPGDNQDRVLMLDPIEWTADGWLIVDWGRGPSAWSMPAPVMRR